ncbi:MAG TPA: response regulator [Kofleriaceae bacterium]|nr:response regulator [Kofleriaceae bacterium]
MNASQGVALWDEFIAGGVRDSRRLADIIGGQHLGQLDRPESRERLGEAAYLAFSIATQALLMGSEPLGRLALAMERLLEAILGGEVVGETAVPYLASAGNTMVQAFDLLASPDRSGARIEGVPLEAARYEIETLLPVPGQAPRGAADVPASALVRRGGAGSGSGSGSGAGPEPGAGSGAAGSGAGAGPAPGSAAAAPSGGAPGAGSTDARSGAASGPAAWLPSVDDDMVELFFAEVNERLEDLSVKLVEIESRPDDPELVRDVFRDLHTLKGSSAMVGLRPMNDLAHAAEDLVGQVRDGERRADRAVIDALLAALDELREIASRAGRREPTSVRADLVRRLRDPSGASAPAPSPAGPAAPAPADPDPAAAAAAPPAAAARQTIRVDFDKLDHLLNLVGELVLGRDSLRASIGSLAALGGELSSDRQLARRIEILAGMQPARGAAGARLAARAAARPGAAAAMAELREELGRVERVLADISHELDHSSGRLDSVSGELREAVMRLRMVPVGGVLRKHHRTVRDLANALGKRARVVLSGEDTELDKLLVEALDEPLLHLVRNAVDHGLEPPDERARAGKPPEGTVQIRAHQRGNQVVIEVADDGRGIAPDAIRRKARERQLASEDELAAMDDEEVLELIFRPGFSTAATVSDVSGRGVGMDVVKQTIVNRLKGTIDIRSQVGAGSTFTLSLPLTLAITQVLLARAGGEVLAVPLDAVVRTLTCAAQQIQLVQDREVLTVRDRQVPLIRLAEVLELSSEPAGAGEAFVILTEQGGDTYGLVCEGLLGKKEIVIKSLGGLLRGVPCAAGATLLGDRCALILDVAAVVARALSRRRAGAGRAAAGAAGAARAAGEAEAPHVLLVEDSDVMRESLRRLLSDAGLRVTTARDGVEGLELARAQRFDLVSTDVMMPRMDGYELTRALRATPEYRDTPIVMVTSRGERIDRVRGFDAGVDEYITKPHDRTLLLKAVTRLLADRQRGDA